MKKTHTQGSLAALSVGALGIVFGDIGTSPLYTLSECINGEHGVGAEQANVLGVLSLIFWSLMFVVTIKYLLFVMRADNHGEGGILALLALLPEKSAKQGVSVIATLVVIGAALLFGDGVITPAISVLSAVEGLGVATTSLQDYVVPITCAILIGLFAIQRYGTAGIGRFFGPVMIAWFATIGGLGVWQIIQHPQVLVALSPTYGATYLVHHGMHGFLLLGSVVLAVTGGEALYADMGHFGAKPIRLAWVLLVLPALALSYLGQGALVVASKVHIDNPFFAQVSPGIATYALVGLSTAATVIASQSLISGVFSLTNQAISLGFFPRVTVTHTSQHAEGQIYLPEINWALAGACVLLVLRFQASAKLAAAYGIAVSGTMAITSIVFYMVARRTWNWPVYKALPVLILFLSFDLPFFAANLFKFKDGGYVPIGIGAVITVLMLVWQRGRRLLGERNAELSTSEAKFLAELPSLLGRTAGTQVFLASAHEGIPRVLNQHAKQLRVLAETVIVFTTRTKRVPFVRGDKRVRVVPIDAKAGIFRVIASVGFMQRTDVPKLLALAKKRGELPQVDVGHVLYMLGRETLLATNQGKMSAVPEAVFGFMLKNARSASDHFALPPDQVIEIGTQIDL